MMSSEFNSILLKLGGTALGVLGFSTYSHSSNITEIMALLVAGGVVSIFATNGNLNRGTLHTFRYHQTLQRVKNLEHRSAD